MKKTSLYKWVCSATVAFGLSATLHAQDAKMAVEDAVLISKTATVKALDLQTRELTLKDELGNETTVTVDKAVKRLDEVKVGDDVTAKYYVSVAAELREPTAEEKKKPLMVIEGATKSPKGAAPAAGGLRMLKVVATVEGLERPTRLLTLKGPRGNYLTVKARDVKRLEKLRLGDTIVVTFTEALAIGVEKAEKQRG